MDLPWLPCRLPWAREDWTVTLIEIVAAALLVVGSVLVIRAVAVSDLAAPPAPERAQPEPVASDWPKAA